MKLPNLALLPAAECKAWLEEWVQRYNQPAFIDDDPISIPHRYNTKEDIEIAGFLIATIAWGQRKSMLRSGQRMMQLLDDSPHQFVVQHQASDRRTLRSFVHRTLNGTDLVQLVRALQHIYEHQGGLQAVVARGVLADDADVRGGLAALRAAFVQVPRFAVRTRKHISDVNTGAACKRLNMYLRWMVRRDKCGVDFGLWHNLQPSQLLMPLDLHTGRVARALGLLSRQQNDLRAVLALTQQLRAFDPTDPVRYDYALFGLGISKLLD